MIEFERLSKDPLVDPCKCRECKGSCERRIRRRWFQCNPCSKGYHSRRCQEYEPDHPERLNPECRRCGFWKEEH